FVSVRASWGLRRLRHCPRAAILPTISGRRIGTPGHDSGGLRLEEDPGRCGSAGHVFSRPIGGGAGNNGQGFPCPSPGFRERAPRKSTWLGGIWGGGTRL